MKLTGEVGARLADAVVVVKVVLPAEALVSLAGNLSNR